MVNEHQVTIQVLSDDVLLYIFLFLRPNYHRHDDHAVSPARMPSLTWAWHRLSQVCRRWRYLMLASPLHLGLGLVTSERRRGTILGLWPPLPISIRYDSPWTLSLEDVQDVIAILEHSNRIFEIKLTISNNVLNSNVWMESFPALEVLCLRPYSRYHSTVLPSGFLGGSALTSRRLRCIVLKGVSVPTLPQLLLSSRGLIHLYLGKDVLSGDCFLSPAVLTAALSAASLLESLHIHLPSNILHEEQESIDSESPPTNLVVLPALTYFNYEGHSSNEYLEDFVSRIHAPLLERIRVLVSQQHARPLDNPRLSQFISRTQYLSSLPQAVDTSITIEGDGLRISLRFGIRGPRQLFFELTCDPGFLRVSQVDHICRQLIPLISDVERVRFEVDFFPEIPLNEPDVARWLMLLRLFDGAQELEFKSVDHFYTAHETTTMGQEVLPALRILWVDIDSPVPRIIQSFIAERERTGRPITVIHPC